MGWNSRMKVYNPLKDKEFPKDIEFNIHKSCEPVEIEETMTIKADEVIMLENVTQAEIDIAVEESRKKFSNTTFIFIGGIDNKNPR